MADETVKASGKMNSGTIGAGCWVRLEERA